MDLVHSLCFVHRQIVFSLETFLLHMWSNRTIIATVSVQRLRDTRTQCAIRWRSKTTACSRRQSRAITTRRERNRKRRRKWCRTHVRRAEDEAGAEDEERAQDEASASAKAQEKLAFVATAQKQMLPHATFVQNPEAMAEHEVRAEDEARARARAEDNLALVVTAQKQVIPHATSVQNPQQERQHPLLPLRMRRREPASVQELAAA